MIININRSGRTGQSISGTYTATSTVTGESVSGYTLENANPPNPNLPVPEGEYSAFVRDKPDPQPDRVQLNDVPGAEAIQLHNGNTPDQAVGCFLVGSSPGEDRVNDSKNALNALTNLIANDGTNNITVNVGPLP